ncbi:triose-phosphate isomerase [uncultured Abyssibacter sp.]|uniref:triose-phosphate isomerase n=1 Tax=uncultured Abyssibacter sp. TaxID=2320202 RepID=UPI0032B175E3
MTRPTIVAGNWKMNGSLAMAENLTEEIAAGAKHSKAKLILCPPFPYLDAVVRTLGDSEIHVGGQNLADQAESGAFTGEVSGTMLRDIGCWYAIVGHSERRSLYGESNETVARKFGMAHDAGLVPILCVGETLEERESGQMEAVLKAQLSAVIDMHGVETLQDAIVAYEPVWAIGTGKTATPEQAQSAHAFLREQVALQNATIAAVLPILYGGSVKPGNAPELFAQSDVDGGLIGGASLKAEDFLGIASAAS